MFCRMLKSLSGKWEKVQVGIGVSEIYRRGLLHLTWAFQQQETSPEPSNSSAVVLLRKASLSSIILLKHDENDADDIDSGRR